MTRRFSNVPGVREEIRLTSARLSGSELPVKQILPYLPFGDDKVATEISVDANPLIYFGPHLFRTILSTLVVLQWLGPLF